MAKTLFYNVHLVDSEIDTQGALLIENDVISAVFVFFYKYRLNDSVLFY